MSRPMTISAKSRGIHLILTGHGQWLVVVDGACVRPAPFCRTKVSCQGRFMCPVGALSICKRTLHAAGVILFATPLARETERIGSFSLR